MCENVSSPIDILGMLYGINIEDGLLKCLYIHNEYVILKTVNIGNSEENPQTNHMFGYLDGIYGVFRGWGL